MTDADLRDWEELPTSERTRIESAAQELARLAWQYATPLIISADAESDDQFNSGTGFIVEFDGTPYLGTAAHVLESYTKRRVRTRYAYIQAGTLGIDAIDRIVFSDSRRDVAFVDLTGLDLSLTDSLIYRPIDGWPPPQPRPGDAIQFCGYPKALRSVPSEESVDFGALPGFGIVATAGDSYCTCQIDRERVITFGEAGQLPPASEFGGLSGGPVLLFGHLSYPVVGLVSQISETFDIIRIATLEGIPTPAS